MSLLPSLLGNLIFASWQAVLLVGTHDGGGGDDDDDDDDGVAQHGGQIIG